MSIFDHLLWNLGNLQLSWQDRGPEIAFDGRAEVKLIYMLLCLNIRCECIWFFIYYRNNLQGIDFRLTSLAESFICVTLEGVPRLRGRARVYGPGGIPVFWIVNIAGRQLEVYSAPIRGAYPAPRILGETESVELIIQGQAVGQIAVRDLLP